MITSEDLVNLTFEGHPEEIEIATIFGRPTSSVRLDMLPQHSFREIERAVIDRGWRDGVRSAACVIRRQPRLSLFVRLAYAA